MTVNRAGRVIPALLLIFLPCTMGHTFAQVDFCRIFGSALVVDNPRYADYRVFVEESEAFCDIVVYQTDNRLFADRPGLWHITDRKGFEDFSIYYEKDRGLADFAVFFTDTESFAGCNR